MTPLNAVGTQSLLLNPVLSNIIKALPQGDPSRGDPSQGSQPQGPQPQGDLHQGDILPEVEAAIPPEMMQEMSTDLSSSYEALQEKPQEALQEEPLPPVVMDAEGGEAPTEPEVSFDEGALPPDVVPYDTSSDLKDSTSEDSDHAGLSGQDSEELHTLSQEHPLWNSLSMALELAGRALKETGKYLTSKEVITAVPHGMANAAIEAVELASSMGEWTNEQLGEIVPGYQQLLDVIPDSHINLPNFQAPKTTT